MEPTATGCYQHRPRPSSTRVRVVSTKLRADIISLLFRFHSEDEDAHSSASIKDELPREGLRSV